MHNALERMVDNLLPQLGMIVPRAGANRVWPGLSDRLRNVPQLLEFPARGSTIGLVWPGVAELRWVGEGITAGLFVSSIGAEALRRTLVLAAVISTHAPSTMLQPGDVTLGDSGFTLTGATHYFSRGNLGVRIRSENPRRPTADLARQLDDAIQREKTIEPAALAGMLPKIADLRFLRTDLAVGETVRASLRLDPAWTDRASCFFDYSTEFLSVDFPEEGSADFTGMAAGTAQVYGCAVEKKTLLSAAKMATLTVRPGQNPAPLMDSTDEDFLDN